MSESKPKRSIEISEGERDTLRSALESYLNDLDDMREREIDLPLLPDLERGANDLDRKLAELRFYHFCAYELCDQSVESDGDICGDHADFNKAIEIGEIAFHEAIEAGETWQTSIERQREAEREAISRLTAERLAKGGSNV